MNTKTKVNYKANQGILPLFFSDFLNINDPVLVFDKFMEGIDCSKYLKNRTIRVNEELTAMQKEVIYNIESIQGTLLRMNRSIQAEGTFGIMKNDRNYKRIVRRGIESVNLELYLVAIGQNLYKYYNKKMRLAKAA